VKTSFRPATLLKLSFLLSVLVAPSVHAEDDGGDFLELLRRTNPKAVEVSQRHIDNAADKWDGSVFCTPVEDRQAARRKAVLDYLESHPTELWRPQRYLIIQGLRSAFPCPKS
jgi:hypothetical protein